MAENSLHHNEIMQRRYSETVDRQSIVSCLDGSQWGDVIAPLGPINPAHRRLILAAPYLYHGLAHAAHVLHSINLRAEMDGLKWLEDSSGFTTRLIEDSMLVATHGLDYWLKLKKAEVDAKRT